MGCYPKTVADSKHDDTVRRYNEYRHYQELRTIISWGRRVYYRPGHRCAGDGNHIAENLRRKVAGHTFEGVGNITCGFGVAAGDDAPPIESLVFEADGKLYEAKAAGRNRVQR